MEKLESHIGRIQTKLLTLLKKHAVLQKEFAQQQETIVLLKQEKEETAKKIRALEEQQYILKSAAGDLNAVEKKAFEQTINKYIREIDKCIALLNE